MEHRLSILPVLAILFASLLLIACQKEEEKHDENENTVEPVLVETLQIEFAQSLAAEWHGEWVYCGRVLDPSYFLNEDLPKELRETDYFIDITKPASENVDKWSNERLRTIYKTLFHHAQTNAENIKKHAIITEHSLSIPSYLTPLYLREGAQTIKITTDSKNGNKLQCVVQSKTFTLEFRPNQIVIADSQPFRWIVLKRIWDAAIAFHKRDLQKGEGKHNFYTSEIVS